MNRKGAWITIGVVFLGVALFGLANLFAQRGAGGRGGPGGPGGFGLGIGRFQVVSSSTSAIIILDTMTGDLFKADPAKDVKPYRDRPRIDLGPPPLDKDGLKDRPPPPKDLRKDDPPPPDKDFKTERKDAKKSADKARP
jgi:hypothetical protein